MELEFICPPNLPLLLMQRARKVEIGDWPAWTLADLTPLMDCLAKSDLAVQAGWLITERDGLLLDGYLTVEGEYHCTIAIHPDNGEAWSDYAARSRGWLLEWAADFAPAKPLKQPETPWLGFVVIWSDRAGMEGHGYTFG